MKVRFFLLLIISFTTTASLAGQDLPRKFAVLDNSSGFAEFEQTYREFSKELLNSGDSVRGFIAFTAGTDEIMTRYKFLRLRMRENPKLRRMLEITRPGTKYRGSWTQTEFWLLPKGNESPYVANTADYFCRPLEISGEHTVGLKQLKLGYSASYPTKTWLDTPYTFKWTVKGGKIISGQGTPEISVRRDKRSNEAIIVTVEIGGGDEEDESCMRTTEFVTQFVKHVEPM